MNKRKKQSIIEVPAYEDVDKYLAIGYKFVHHYAYTPVGCSYIKHVFILEQEVN